MYTRAAARAVPVERCRPGARGRQRHVAIVPRPHGHLIIGLRAPDSTQPVNIILER